MSTSQMALRLSSTVVSSSCAQIGHPDQSRRITLATRQSDGLNTHSVPAAPSHLALPHGILALSPPVLVFLKLSLPVQVKHEKISLQTLHQSLSLRRVRVKKESRSPSPRILLGPPRRQRSPPHQQSLTYVDRRQAPLGPDSPLFGTRIPPGTSTQSPTTSISPSTLFDTFDGARRLLEARHGRPDASARFAPSHTEVAGLSRLGIEPRGMPSTTATGPKWPYVSLHLRVRHDVTLPMDLRPLEHSLLSKFDQQKATTAASAPAPSSVPPAQIMSSPSTAPNKETLRLLLPLRYDGKTIIECNRFLSQLRIYWMVNTSLTTIELKVQVALSLLNGDARAWATPYFAQLASVQVGVQGVTTPFANEAAFAATFKARFGILNDEAAVAT
ncbi:predicted protein [Postia placenta Mad-698-R]|nr:predicted protein [Postia placenta Mad-698-R]